MIGIGGALARAAGDLFRPRLLWLMLWPIVASLALWGAGAALYGDRLIAAVRAWLDMVPAVRWLGSWVSTDALGGAAGWILLTLVFVLGVLCTITAITGFVIMPKVVAHVAAARFPSLARRRGGTFRGSTANTVAATLVAFAVAAVSLPLWLVPGLGLVIPLLVFGWLNARVLAYDALAEHADAAELRNLMAHERSRLRVLGLVASATGMIPFFGLLAPLFAALAFAHYLLARVAEARRDSLAVH